MNEDTSNLQACRFGMFVLLQVYAVLIQAQKICTMIKGELAV